ncbi:MAG: zinc-binding alcohol dehydrogenase [Planctomycetota bacterium]
MNIGQPEAPEEYATAYWATGPQMGELRSHEEAISEHDEPSALVRTWYSGLSRGTERLVHHGLVPPSERERMRAPFQKGDFPFPVKYGYMAVGRVEAGPAPFLGRDVFCLHPHQDFFHVPVSALTLIPEDVPMRRAVLAANMETAVNVLWDANPGIGDRIRVVGAGVVGSLVGYLASRVPGVDAALVDVLPRRETLARRLGLAYLPGPASDDPFERGANDLVIHTSGAPLGLQDALTLAGPEARVVEASWYGDQDVSAPLGGAFHSQRLELRSSQVGRIPARQAARWTYKRRMELALRLLSDDALDALISSVDPFESIPDRIHERLSSPETLCAVFAYPPAE